MPHHEPSPSPRASATPWGANALLRDAAAAAAGLDIGRIPPADPRRAPAAAEGDYSSALPIRLARAAGRPAPYLATEIAARVRERTALVGVSAEASGFVTLTLTPAARESLVRVAADDPAYLVSGGAPGVSPGVGSPEPHLSPLHEQGSVGRARLCARHDARERIDAAAESGVVRTPSGARGPDDVSWRDPHLDGPSGDTEAARLLAVIGEASARIAFCRSVHEHPRTGETTGAGLPALPTADAPGRWARHTDANPAFHIRYAHAHAVATRRWVRDAASAGPLSEGPAARDRSPYPVGPIVSDRDSRPVGGHPGPPGGLDGPAAVALVGELFDGPGLLRAAARRREPHILVRYLDGVATAYHEWREPRDAQWASGPHTAGIAARLDLCAAAAGVLRTGLFLLGVSAPTRL